MQPRLPYTNFGTKNKVPFFGVNERLPLLLALVMGLQHSLAMVGGVITPSIVGRYPLPYRLCVAICAAGGYLVHRILEICMRLVPSDKHFASCIWLLS